MKPLKYVLAISALSVLTVMSSCSKTVDMPFGMEELKNANTAQAMNEAFDTVRLTDCMDNLKIGMGQDKYEHDIYVRKSEPTGENTDVYMTDSNGEETYIANGTAYVKIAENEYLTVFYTDGYYENIIMPSYNVFSKDLLEISDGETPIDFEENEDSYILTTSIDFSLLEDKAHKAYLDYYWGISEKKGTNVYTIDKDSLLITSLKQYYKDSNKPVLYYSLSIEGNATFSEPVYAAELISPRAQKTVSVIIDPSTENERAFSVSAAANSMVEFNSTVNYNKYTDVECTKAFDYINTPDDDFTLYFLSVTN